ncbi:MAG: branched-chain amino acid aminotransferase [Bacteroidia bacterium]|nr:branched-chain amino acid aminotransferase [Bacteroidia bacterium]MDW8347391.1 branched-chain amino acid aminotransferase [Bacteroidia bacterium]
MELNIEIHLSAYSRINEVNFNDLGFGRYFTDHLLIATYKEKAWQTAKIIPFQDLSIHPALSALHYGQSIFEGMKAFKYTDGSAVLFRPEKNWQRINTSARRLCMPEIPEDLFIEGLKLFVDIERNWIPSGQGEALYLRPLLFATDSFLGVRPSEEYLFLVIASPVGKYYSQPIRVLAQKQYVRAVRGGVGAAKTAGNYAASLLAVQEAKKKGYDQILWLDAIQLSFVEESSTMNLFFVIDDAIYTAPASPDGTILMGVTRDSAITLLKKWGYEVYEKPLNIQDIIQAYHKGTFQEAFGTGTAASITPLAAIGFDDQEIMPIANTGYGPISQRLYETLTGIQRGTIADELNWLVRVPEYIPFT